jgi:FkbM family methyltransferase
MDYSHPALILLRRFGQRLHMLRPIVRLWRRISGSAYEEAFDKYVVSKITPGAVVWDVGANVGFFAEKFSMAVGHAGKVVAFDPSPSCVATLRERFSTQNNVIVEPVGLSDSTGIADFSVSEHADPTGGLGIRAGHNDVVKVNITTGDIYANTCTPRKPNYIKIDVEGYEWEVINGLTTVLTTEELKAVFIEVHFLELAKRGLVDAPTKIVLILRNNGFTVRWIDPSHLAAERM